MREPGKAREGGYGCRGVEGQGRNRDEGREGTAEGALNIVLSRILFVSMAFPSSRVLLRQFLDIRKDRCCYSHLERTRRHRHEGIEDRQQQSSVVVRLSHEGNVIHFNFDVKCLIEMIMQCQSVQHRQQNQHVQRL